MVRNTFNYANAYYNVQYLDLGYWGSIQKEVISSFEWRKPVFCQKRYGSLYDRSLERDLLTGFKTLYFYLEYAIKSIQQCIYERQRFFQNIS